MKLINRTAYLLWPIGLLILSAIWSYIKYGDLVVSDDWFDTAHYLTIANDGYTEPFLTAFFPGFPKLWGLLGLSVAGMAIMNALLWLAAVAWLDLKCEVRRRALVLASVVPQVLFFAIPYSEALFFVTAAVTATGLARKNLVLTSVGVFASALIRPTAALLIPALFAARLMSGQKWGEAAKKSVPEVLAGLAGVAVVFFIQYLDTGSWLGFFEAQKGWGNGFGWPRIPLQSWGGDVITMVDAMALFVGIFAGRTLWHTRRGGLSKLSEVERFGLAGMFFTVLLILFTRGGEVFSLNRFVFATVFFPLSLSAWSHTVFHKRELPLLFIAWILFSLLFRSYLHIAHFGLYMGGGVIIFLVINALRSEKLRWLTLLGLVVASAAMVVYFYQVDRWIG